MDTKCKIVPLDMVGRTENGTVYFSADEITVFFQFIGVNHFGFGQKDFEAQQTEYGWYVCPL